MLLRTAFVIMEGLTLETSLPTGLTVKGHKS